MTVNEFRAWLEGFEEGIKGSPTKAQWEKIKLRLEDVNASDGHDYCHGGYYRTWWPDWTWTSPRFTWANTDGTTSGNTMTVSNKQIVSSAYTIGQIEANAS